MKHLDEYVISNKALMLFFEAVSYANGHLSYFFFTSVYLNYLWES